MIRAHAERPHQLGLVGFLVANGFAFLISHQVYGDALIMVLTAFMIGVVLSSPRWSGALGQRPVVVERERLPQRFAHAE